MRRAQCVLEEFLCQSLFLCVLDVDAKGSLLAVEA